MIHIFCALPCEAQPLIQHFKLSELKQFDLFRIYQSDNSEISLIITGIGKMNTAAAVSYHHACINSNPSDIWLNIGIAGHKDLNVGEARLINKITDEHDQTHWYPQIIFKTACENMSLITIDQPSTDYQDAMFDMEASAFYQFALRLGTAELIHCFKVISDNTEQSTSKVNADNVKKLITSHINTIEKIIQSLKPLSEEIRTITADPEHYQAIVQQWHFTQSQKLQLSRLLKQWALRVKTNDLNHLIADAKTAKSVLNRLQDKINETEFVLHD